MTQSRFNAFFLSLARARHRGLATLAVVALGVAGCGGGGSRLSKAEYQQHLTKDARGITKAFVPLTTPPRSLDQFASELKTGASRLRVVANDLDGIKPPRNAEKDNAALVTGLNRLADESSALRSAAEAKDAARLQKGIADLRRQLVDLRRAAVDLRKKGYSLAVSQ
jgi:hypothetical protein